MHSSFTPENPLGEGGGPPDAIFFYVSCTADEAGCRDACPARDKLCKRLQGKQLSEAAPQTGRNGRENSCQRLPGPGGQQSIWGLFSHEGMIIKAIINYINFIVNQSHGFSSGRTNNHGSCREHPEGGHNYCSHPFPAHVPSHYFRPLKKGLRSVQT